MIRAAIRCVQKEKRRCWPVSPVTVRTWMAMPTASLANQFASSAPTLGRLRVVAAAEPLFDHRVAHFLSLHEYLADVASAPVAKGIAERDCAGVKQVEESDRSGNACRPFGLAPVP